MTETETDQSSEGLSGLKAIWANTQQPVAPLPWYRRVSPKLAVAGVVVVGLATALVVAAMTGAGAPPRHRIVLADRVGDRVRLPDDGNTQAVRADYEGRMTALRPYRELAVAGYGDAGTTKTTLTVVGLVGSFPEPGRELRKYFGRMEGGDVMRETVTELQDFPAGPLGGELLCAVLVYPSVSETTCAWADGSTVGIVTDTTGEDEPEELAKRTLDIRAAVEVEAEG
ncbi:hypothetical protein [Streptomyces sp. FH025]|uniref:hypothetical protein n=1 Tax=Streptomyces sp. FH025 TaxID=2815937 RepID=UPI001A9D0581|nr:hypothetical protein [Streptomyces sp. FH025]MBO1414796.1 hypothetical protein [Streptomyces sp. FH025]